MPQSPKPWCGLRPQPILSTAALTVPTRSQPYGAQALPAPFSWA